MIRSLFPRLENPGLRTPRLILANHRAHSRIGITRVSRWHTQDLFDQALLDGLNHCFLDEKHLHRRAHLSRLTEGCIGNLWKGAIHIGVGAQDRARYAAEFKLGLAQSCRLLNETANTRTAGKGVKRNRLLVEQCSSNRVSLTLKQSQEPWRQARFEECLAQQRSRQRCQRRWLQYYRVSCRQSRRDLVQHGIER